MMNWLPLLFCIAAICIGLLALLTKTGRTEPDGNIVEIRRTSYGIPHIKAANEKKLGYGIGYAYAEDNICLLANEIVTVNGSRSKYFGDRASNEDGIENPKSDFFFRWLNAEDRVDMFLQAQKPEIRNLLIGYAAGYNYYLHQINTKQLPKACRNQTWVQDISERDLVKLIRRLTVLNGVGHFAEALVSAQPPTELHPTRLNRKENGQRDFDMDELSSNSEDNHGSNAIALGRALTQNGKGMLLGNPHFPWSGALRFYEMHLTIPGKVDVMGAALPGLPAINIGFSHDIAWTHTVDTSSHLTFYHLTLDPDDPTKYIVDGKAIPMRRRPIVIEVANQDGVVERSTQIFYETMFGPILSDSRFAWTKSDAFAIQDANFDNDRSLEQWSSMNSAKTLEDFKTTIETVLGIPWVNTIAADRNGSVVFMNVSPIPKLDAVAIAACSWSASSVKNTPVILDGSKTACDWKDGHADKYGLFSANSLPTLQRDDYVQNSNGSAWLTNPLAPLVGFSPLVSKGPNELNERTRFALNWLQDETGKAKNERQVTPEDLERLLFSDKVYLASITMNDVMTLCHEATSNDLSVICDTLAAWDRTAGKQANLGYLYFQKFIEVALNLPHIWAVPFNAAAPLTTPRGLNLGDPDVFRALIDALLLAQSEVAKLGVLPDATWGQIQRISKDGRDIAIPGGSGFLGVYNAIQSTPLQNGRREVRAGSAISK